MAARQGERRSWTLCISGDVDRISIVSVSKVNPGMDPVQLALFFDNLVYDLAVLRSTRWLN